MARIRALAANEIDPAGPAAWRVDVPSLHTIIDGMLAALTNQNLVRAVADLAGIDPVVVLQPPSLDFLTGPAVNDLLNLDNLTLVHDAGTSHGANLIADPALDLRDTDERRLQIDSWLLQIGLDAGLRGMEPLLAGYHKTRQPT